jgi:hypothetical protein
MVMIGFPISASEGTKRVRTMGTNINRRAISTPELGAEKSFLIIKLARPLLSIRIKVRLLH